MAKVKAVCPNCGRELDRVIEYWSGNSVIVENVMKLDKDGVRNIKTVIDDAEIDPDTFAFLCPYCNKEIILEKPADIGGDSNKTDVEIISDFLSGKIKGKPEK